MRRSRGAARAPTAITPTVSLAPDSILPTLIFISPRSMLDEGACIAPLREQLAHVVGLTGRL